jgi:hypothetical protein
MATSSTGTGAVGLDAGSKIGQGMCASTSHSRDPLNAAKPITQNLVCTCEGQASDNNGYIISKDCKVVNVDKCAMGVSTCHRNVMCLDRDASLNASHRFECQCPPGLIGDGITSCNVYAYETRFSLVRKGVSASSFDKAAFQMILVSRGVIPSTLPQNRISITVSQYTAPVNRRLLQNETSDTQVDVTIFSETVADMNSMTQTVNATLLGDSGYWVLSVSTSFESAQNNADEPVAAISPGFQITSVQFDDTKAQWQVDIKYTAGIPNTITSLYLSRPGTIIPYTQAVKNTFYISQHPCLLSSSVCCLNNYKNSYAVGAFAQNITSAIGTCDVGMQARETIGLFDPVYSQNLVEHALDSYPDSSVERQAANHVRLRITQTDLSTGGLAMRTPLENSATGYQLTFFVGMTYLTLLPANSMSVVASQTSVTLSVSNSITFSFASSQDNSVVKYLTLSVMQNKWVDGLIERKMQFVQMGFVLPANSMQNMETGLVPLTSIRFAIAQGLPDRNNASMWTNPCFSSDSTGMYDVAQGYYNLYAQAAEQTCAARFAPS